jgi:hypothetical protein
MKEVFPGLLRLSAIGPERSPGRIPFPVPITRDCDGRHGNYTASCSVSTANYAIRGVAVILANVRRKMDSIELSSDSGDGPTLRPSIAGDREARRYIFD